MQMCISQFGPSIIILASASTFWPKHWPPGQNVSLGLEWSASASGIWPCLTSLNQTMTSTIFWLGEWATPRDASHTFVISLRLVHEQHDANLNSWSWFTTHRMHLPAPFN